MTTKWTAARVVPDLLAGGAQTAPPGSPTIWLRPEDISATGSNIDSIANHGSFGGSFVATLGARPTTTTIDGKTCAVFDGSASLMTSTIQVSDALAGQALRYTVCAVIKTGASLVGADGATIDTLPALITDTGVGNFEPIVTQVGGFEGGHYASASSVPLGAAVASTIYLVTHLYETTGKTLWSSLFGGAASKAAAADVGALGGFLRLGQNYSGSAKLAATHCELIIYPTALNASDRAKLDSYMRSRWPSISN